MRKVSKHQWQLNKTRIKKRMRELNRRNKTRPVVRKKTQTGSDYNYRLVAPANFSLIGNTYEVLLFFEEVFRIASLCRLDQKVFIDLSAVMTVSADAIIYMIALIRNTKRLQTLRITISGNMPKDDAARAYFEDVGFYKYVSRLTPSRGGIINNTSKFSISHGASVDPILVGQICDFTEGDRNVAPTETKQLYRMILELMTNTAQHAYTGSAMTNHWYVFAEKKNDEAIFVFLDTGVGIPKTIKYKAVERVKRLIEQNASDAKYISSALKGDFRTETGKVYRGKGLPGVYEDSINGTISSMTIFSGGGKCIIQNSGDIKEQIIKHRLEGSLFFWNYKMNKENRETV